MTFTLEPIIPTKEQSGVDFGAIVTDLDLETITRKIIYIFMPETFLYTTTNRNIFFFLKKSS